MQVEGLCKSLKGFHLGPVDFHLEPGYVTAVIGKNGSGKSTLFSCLLGLHQYEGRVALGIKKEEMAFMLDACPFPMDYSAIQAAKCFGGMYQGFDIRRFREVCGKNNIPLKRSLKKLSRGMVMMVQYAFAASYPAKLLILDEATAHLDTFAKKELYTFISEFAAGGGMVLWASHTCEELDKMADYVLGLKNGKEEFFMDRESLMDSYVKVSGSAKQLDYMKGSLLGRRDGEMGSTGLIDGRKKPAHIFGTTEPVRMEDIIEFVL